MCSPAVEEARGRADELCRVSAEPGHGSVRRERLGAAPANVGWPWRSLRLAAQTGSRAARGGGEGVGEGLGAGAKQGAPIASVDGGARRQSRQEEKGETAVGLGF